MIVGAGKLAVRKELGYSPAKACWTDSRARGIGVARIYIKSLSDIAFGICCISHESDSHLNSDILTK